MLIASQNIPPKKSKKQTKKKQKENSKKGKKGKGVLFPSPFL
jgi:hypothetical protein